MGNVLGDELDLEFGTWVILWEAETEKKGGMKREEGGKCRFHFMECTEDEAAAIRVPGMAKTACLAGSTRALASRLMLASRLISNNFFFILI